MPPMASLAMKKKAERRLRQLLREGGFAQPEEVEYGRRSVTLFWHSVKKSIVVDVTERGEVGETRVGPPSPRWDTPTSSGNGSAATAAGGATLHQKKAAERDTRAMLEDRGLPQPDEVEYGDGSIRLLWYDTKVCMIVDIDQPAPRRGCAADVNESALARELPASSDDDAA